MKKIFLIILILFLFCGGCKNYSTQKKDEDTSLLGSLKKINQNNNLEENEFVCDDLTENSIMEGNIFVTDNVIYKLNLKKKFSNNTNCIKIGKILENRKTKYISHGRIIDNFGNIYRQKDSSRDDDYNTDNEEYKLDPTIISNIVELYGKDSIYSSNTFANKFYRADILIFNGKQLIGYYNPCDAEESKEDIINIDNITNEKIIKIYGYIVKTNKNFYIIKENIINEEECKKYADIKCKFEYYLSKSNILSEYYKEVLYIDSSTIITKNHTYIEFNDID